MQAVPVSLKVVPLTFEIDAAGGKQVIVLENTSQVRICFKIKTTNIEHYKLSKVYGFIEVGKSDSVQVTRSFGPARNDRFVVQFLAAADPKITDPSTLFVNKEEKGVSLVCSLNIFVNAVTKQATTAAKDQKPADDSFMQPTPVPLPPTLPK